MLSRKVVQMVTDSTAPGLMLFGLHNELPSSDNDDADYEPPSDDGGGGGDDEGSESESDGDDSSDDSDTSENDNGDDKKNNGKAAGKKKAPNKGKSKSKKTVDKTTKQKKTTTTTTVKKKKSAAVVVKRRSRMRPFGADLHCDGDSEDDSEDDDYVPDDGQKDPTTTRKRKLDNNKMKGSPNKKQKKKVDDEQEDDSGSSRSTEHWSLLPVEILSRIFHLLTSSHEKGVRFLCRCACVCKHWREVAEEPVSWRDIDVSFVGPGLGKQETDKLLLRLSARHLRETRSLNLSGWRLLTDGGLVGVADNCPKLERLDVSNCQQKSVAKVSGASLIPLAENCTLLTHISASNLRIAVNYSKTLTEFIEIRGSELVHINFSNNIAFSSASLSAIMRNCSQLVYLDCSNTAVRGIYMNELQTSCPLLRELYLANVSLEVKDKPDDLRNSPGFQQLVLASFASPRGGNSWMTGPILHSMLKWAENLTTLDIRGCERLTEIDMQIGSDVIERLYMSRCRIKDDFVHSLCERWSRTLWDLDVSNVGCCVSSFLRNLLDQQDPCENLLHLNLSCTDVVDSDLSFVLSKCRDLETLDVTSCRGLSRGLKRLYSGKEDFSNLEKQLKKTGV